MHRPRWKMKTCQHFLFLKSSITKRDFKLIMWSQPLNLWMKSFHCSPRNVKGSNVVFWFGWTHTSAWFCSNKDSISCRTCRSPSSCSTATQQHNWPSDKISFVLLSERKSAVADADQLSDWMDVFRLMKHWAKLPREVFKSRLLFYD